MAAADILKIEMISRMARPILTKFGTVMQNASVNYTDRSASEMTYIVSSGALNSTQTQKHRPLKNLNFKIQDGRRPPF